MSYMPCSATTIGNYFLQKASKALQERGALTPMQVLKLAYIAHGCWLCLYKHPFNWWTCGSVAE